MTLPLCQSSHILLPLCHQMTTKVQYRSMGWGSFSQIWFNLEHLCRCLDQQLPHQRVNLCLRAPTLDGCARRTQRVYTGFGLKNALRLVGRESLVLSCTEVLVVGVTSGSRKGEVPRSLWCAGVSTLVRVWQCLMSRGDLWSLSSILSRNSLGPFLL
jgi:hypothetical protein